MLPQDACLPACQQGLERTGGEYWTFSASNPCGQMRRPWKMPLYPESLSGCRGRDACWASAGSRSFDSAGASCARVDASLPGDTGVCVRVLARVLCCLARMSSVHSSSSIGLSKLGAVIPAHRASLWLPNFVLAERRSFLRNGLSAWLGSASRVRLPMAGDIGCLRSQAPWPRSSTGMVGL